VDGYPSLHRLSQAPVVEQVTGADVPLNCHLGGALLLPHHNGSVIHPDAEIGPNCLLFQQVTIEVINGGAPTL
jgi:serine O-acetyltransferase